MKIAIINGPNLNLLGTREPEKYGTTTLAELEKKLLHESLTLGVELCFKQSNHEGELIDFIHSIKNTVKYIIINPAAFTHTSIALRDALLSVNIPFIEVHISNLLKREPFRHHSYLSDIAVGTIGGLGILGYSLALQYFMEQ